MKHEVGRYVSEESNYNNWIIQSEKSLATLDCFGPYLVNVAIKEYCSICLETAFISKEFGMKILMWLRLLKISEAGHTVRVPFQELLFRAMLAYQKSDLNMQLSVTTEL